MKNRLVMFAGLVAALALTACQGSNNTPSNINSTACTQQTTYNANGMPVQTCVAPNSYNNGYNAYNQGNNPCAGVAQQVNAPGVIYVPQMVNGQWWCMALN